MMYKIFLMPEDIEVAEFDTLKECTDYIKEMVEIVDDSESLLDKHNFAIYQLRGE